MNRIIFTIAITVIGLLLATPPELPAPNPVKGLGDAADGEWIPQFDFDGKPTGPAFRWRADHPIWSDPKFSPQIWPSLYQPGSLWDYDPAKQAAWTEAGKWGRPTWVISRVPSSPTFPVGWLSVGSVCWDGYTYRMRLAGGTLTDVPTVDLQTGEVSALLAEREVRAVTARFGVQLPAD